MAPREKTVTDEDIIAHLLRAFCAAVPGVPDTTVKELNYQARVHWGGSRPYVPKLGPIELRRDSDIPRATYYRWMHRSPPRR